MMSCKFLTAVAAATLWLAVAQPLCAQVASSPATRPAPVKTTTASPAPIRAEPLPPQVDQTFKLWDADHNGALSEQEFRNGWRSMRRAVEVRSGLHEQFTKVDVNGNKAIDAGEYGNLVLVQEAGKAAPPLSAFDKNKNQRLEFSEYLTMVRQLSGRRKSAPAPAK